MAMYNSEKIKGFYSEIGNKEDICFYCAKKIRDDKSLTLDQTNDKIKELKGSLLNKRIVKIKTMGRELCICPQCIYKMNLEVNPDNFIHNKEAETENTEVTEEKPKTNTRKKTKNNEQA